uniref:Uncharacterized protein n=1 Tax=Cacopsylla melanoneura TaxID=428564 RepID=A0A8D9ASC7_9HEMI
MCELQILLAQKDAHFDYVKTVYNLIPKLEDSSICESFIAKLEHVEYLQTVFMSILMEINILKCESNPDYIPDFGISHRFLDFCGSIKYHGKLLLDKQATTSQPEVTDVLPSDVQKHYKALSSVGTIDSVTSSVKSNDSRSNDLLGNKFNERHHTMLHDDQKIASTFSQDQPKVTEVIKPPSVFLCTQATDIACNDLSDAKVLLRNAIIDVCNCHEHSQVFEIQLLSDCSGNQSNYLSKSIIKLGFVLQLELISDYLVFSAYWSNRPCAQCLILGYVSIVSVPLGLIQPVIIMGKFLSDNIKYLGYILKLLLPSQ